MKSAIAAIILLLVMPNLWAQSKENGPLDRITFFEGDVTFTKGNDVLQVPLLVEKLTIEGGQRLTLEFPFKGIKLVQLRAGELIHYAGQEKIERKPEEFWVILPDQQIVIETEDDKAILDVHLLGEKYLEFAGDKSLVSNWELIQERYQQIGENVFSRKLHLIGDPRSPIATVMILNVGPQKASGEIKFEGSALIQVISGSGLVETGNQERRAELGTTIAINDGEVIKIDNQKNDKPIKLRAIIYQN